MSHRVIGRQKNGPFFGDKLQLEIETSAMETAVKAD